MAMFWKNLRTISLIWLYLGYLPLWLNAQTTARPFQGQGPTERVDTRNHAVVPQWRGQRTWGGVTFDNDFAGARLNGITQSDDSTFTALIAAENYPINPSPWYAFRVSAKQPRTIRIKLTYLQAKHRYYPKISRDGRTWQPLDSADYQVERDTAPARTFQDNAQALSATLRLQVDTRPLWVAGQEIIHSHDNARWVKQLAKKPFVTRQVLGHSPEGRPIHALRIGTDAAESRVVIIIGRLHPPEVTGQLALQTFVETLCADTDTARLVRQRYTFYVVPMLNPDGVDNGHWRHNTGGIDLNRDWADFNQPETRLVRDFLREKLRDPQRKLYFGIDFHSTWDDIFYTNNTERPTNMPDFIPRWFAALEAAMPGYKVNSRPSKIAHGVISKAFFAREFNAEALVYEVGDNTPRDFTARKSRTAAVCWMRLALTY